MTHRYCLLALLLGTAAAAQEFTLDQPSVFISRGHDVVVMPSATVDLPETLHPVTAIEMLNSLPERPRATLRIRAPDIQWR